MALRIVLGFVGCSAALYWAWLIAEYGRLPPRIPTHFAGDGVPDTWSETSLLSWYGGPAMGMVVVATLVGVALLILWMARRHPASVNIPLKEEWSMLTPDGRAWCLEPMAIALALSAFPVLGVFAYLSWSSAQIGRGAMQTSPAWPLIAMVSIVMLTIVGSIAVVTARVRRASGAR